MEEEKQIHETNPEKEHPFFTHKERGIKEKEETRSLKRNIVKNFSHTSKIKATLGRGNLLFSS